MHVPINIPSLSMSTGKVVDMNNELIAHGYSNIISGFCGGLQNYLCYSNSLLYFKCHGKGKFSGYLLVVITAVFFIIGPSMVYYIPRAMAGCLLMHVGIDLTREAVNYNFKLFLFTYVWIKKFITRSGIVVRG
jgi:SulP family sulfate permease